MGVVAKLGSELGFNLDGAVFNSLQFLDEGLFSNSIGSKRYFFVDYVL